MRECWINIYRNGAVGGPWATRDLAEAVANKFTSYRIHVRLKDTTQQLGVRAFVNYLTRREA
jgi:hypothetical protein